MNVAVRIRIVVGGKHLIPVICGFCQQRQQDLCSKIQIAAFPDRLNVLIRQVVLRNGKHAFQCFQIKFIAERDLHITIALQCLIQRIKHPCRAGVPVSERIGIGGLRDNGFVPVRVYRCLNRVRVAMGRKRVFFPVRHLPQKKIYISNGRRADVARVHGRNLQVYICVHRVFAAPACIPLAGPHAVKPACRSSGTAKICVSAGVKCSLRQCAADIVFTSGVLKQRFVGCIAGSAVQRKGYGVKLRLMQGSMRV